MGLWGKSRDEEYYEKLHHRYHSAYFRLNEAAQKALEADHKIKNALKYARIVTQLHKDVHSLEELRNSKLRHFNELRRIGGRSGEKEIQLKRAKRDALETEKQVREKRDQLSRIRKVTHGEVHRKIDEFKNSFRKVRHILGM